MARWSPDGGERLQRAAVALFAEHGFDAVTVPAIAERAGLSTRSFFNHFADKREVLFAGSEAFQETAAQSVRHADPGLEDLDAVVRALTAAGRSLEPVMPYARLRTELVEGSADLRERELAKNAALTAALTAALEERGSSRGVATLVAQVGMSVFLAAFAEWVETPDAGWDDLVRHWQDVLVGAVHRS